MENLSYEFAGAKLAPALQQQVMVGVVGSGDLEVLIEAHTDTIQINVCTSVDGMAGRWQSLMQRVFDGGTLPAMRVDINDFGATPGVVRLRLDQALEELGLVDQQSGGK
ncbi:malonate decarboxylase delta subunit [Oxalobacteraceae bacterium GrIS 2.11]